MDWKKLLVFSSVLFTVVTGTAAAAEPGAIVGSEVEGEQIVLYVQSPGEITQVQCQVGTTSCTDIAYGLIEEQEVPVKTLLLIDNSLSVSQKYRPKINEIMTNLVANRMQGEQITVATFSDKITYLLENSSDYTQLKQTVDSIAYQDQETYLTDVLYEVLAAWNQDEDTAFRRIVIVSDGVDNKAIGYTKEELYELLRKHPYPIYTMGCAYQSGNNSEELKNMFALSRMTQASSWMLDPSSDALQIANEVAAGNQTLRVVIAPPVEVLDGAAKGVKLSVTSGETTVESAVTVDMPFGTAPPETEPETKATEPETQEETEEETEPEAEEDGLLKKQYIMYGIMAGAVLLVLSAMIVLIVRAVKKSKKENAFETAPEDAFNKASQYQNFSGNAMRDTEIMPQDAGNTAMVWGPSGRTYMLILTDLRNPARSFEAPLRSSVLIGRSRNDGCQIVLDYDRSVSHRHCQIRVVNGQFWVKDLGSRNGTILNGKRVIQEAVLTSGSILTLGNLKMKVELR